MDSDLLKSAIADAKAVRDTAMLNAKAMLEEAFTPKLQSMLSAKLQQEMADANIGIDEDPNAYGSADTAVTEEADPNIGIDEDPNSYGSSDTAVTEGQEELEEFNALQRSGLETQHGESPDIHDVPSKIHETEVPANSSDTDKSDMKGSAGQIKASDQDSNQTPNVETTTLQKQNSPLTPSDTDRSDMRGSAGQIKASDQDSNQTPNNDVSSELHLRESEEVEDDEELNEIISELESELDVEDELGGLGDELGGEDELGAELGDELGGEEEIAVDEVPVDDIAVSDDVVDGEESAGFPVDDVASDDEDIDLDEILREMELESEAPAAPADNSAEMAGLREEIENLQKENAKYKKTLGVVSGQLNEVNLLNAKLLYTNKVFKNVALNNEQKMRVVESFDRTRNVREVKLTYANLCETFKLANANKKTRIAEGVASQAVKSTAPSKPAVQRQKQILAEGNVMADRMKKLAGIK